MPRILISPHPHLGERPDGAAHGFIRDPYEAHRHFVRALGRLSGGRTMRVDIRCHLLEGSPAQQEGFED